MYRYRLYRYIFDKVFSIDKFVSRVSYVRREKERSIIYNFLARLIHPVPSFENRYARNHGQRFRGISFRFTGNVYPSSECDLPDGFCAKLGIVDVKMHALTFRVFKFTAFPGHVLASSTPPGVRAHVSRNKCNVSTRVPSKCIHVQR